MERIYTVGVDFGTLSARALLLDAVSGEQIASSVFAYPHGVMESMLPDGTQLGEGFALQHPEDYLVALRETVVGVLQKSGVKKEAVVGLGIDFTSCTLLPILADGTPLCQTARFGSEPHAWVKLWKHHGAQYETERMTEVAKARGETFLERFGGKFFSEWGLPKIYETLRNAPEVFDAADRFVEAGDWLTLLLTGEVCTSAIFAALKFNCEADRGFPSDDFLRAVDPRLEGLVGTKLCDRVLKASERAGKLSAQGAELTGLCEGTPLSVPIIDAEAAIPALGITDEGVLMLVLGTSGCHVIHSKQMRPVHDICGYVKDGVVPDLYTYEAGQSGLGDCFDWFVKNCVPEHYSKEARERGMKIHAYLREKARALGVGESGLVALDWLGGNRSVLQRSELSGLILGLRLDTKPEEIYRALIEATAFGTRTIVETFVRQGVEIGEIRAAGGIAQKDDLLMQIYADVCARPIHVYDTEQAGALGSAIYAAVAAGVYPNLTEACDALAAKPARTYLPNPENTHAYDALYAEYTTLYDYFGRGANDVMRRIGK